jgi:hypothetical protein
MYTSQVWGFGCVKYRTKSKVPKFVCFPSNKRVQLHSGRQLDEEQSQILIKQANVCTTKLVLNKIVTRSLICRTPPNQNNAQKSICLFF